MAKAKVENTPQAKEKRTKELDLLLRNTSLLPKDKLKKARELILQGVANEVKTEDKRSTLMLLISNGFSLLTHEFLGINFPDLATQDSAGNTALHDAASQGNTFIVRNLLTIIKADKDIAHLVNAQNMNGDTPLMEAAKKGYLDIVKLLLKAGAQSNLTNKQGKTALDIARDNGHDKVVTFLESADAKKDAKEAEQAIFHEQIAQELIAAIKEGVTKTVQAIFKDIEQGKIPKDILNYRDNQDKTVWDYAFNEGNFEAMIFLIRLGIVDIDSRNLEGNTPLALATLMGNLAVVKQLLIMGADSRSKNGEELTPLELAKRHNHGDIISYIEKFQAAQMEELSGAEAIPEIIRPFPIDTGKIVLEYWNKDLVPASFIETPELKRSKKLFILMEEISLIKRTPTGLCFGGKIRHEKIKEVNALLEAGVDINAQDENGYTILTWLFLHDFPFLVRQVLNSNPNLALKDNKYSATALHWAVYKGNTFIVREVLKKIQETNQLDLINVPDKQGITPLMEAIREGHLEVAKLLIAANADFRTLRNNDGQTAFEFAQARGRTGIRAFMEAFEQAGQAAGDSKQPSAKDSKQTPKQRALTLGMFEDNIPGDIKPVIDAKLFKQQGRERRAQELTSALMDGEAQEAKRLLQLDFDANYQNHEGFTPLHPAVMYGDNDTVQSLLTDHKANPNIQTKAGFTALHSAALRGFLPVTQTLLAHNADLNFIDRSYTPLARAATAGHTNIAEALLRAGADHTLANNQGQTPLMIAQSKKHSGVGVVKCIQQFIADEKARSRSSLGVALTGSILQARRVGAHADVLGSGNPVISSASIPGGFFELPSSVTPPTPAHSETSASSAHPPPTPQGAKSSGSS